MKFAPCQSANESLARSVLAALGVAKLLLKALQEVERAPEVEVERARRALGVVRDSLVTLEGAPERLRSIREVFQELEVTLEAARQAVRPAEPSRVSTSPTSTGEPASPQPQDSVDAFLAQAISRCIGFSTAVGIVDSEESEGRSTSDVNAETSALLASLEGKVPPVASALGAPSQNLRPTVPVPESPPEQAYPSAIPLRDSEPGSPIELAISSTDIVLGANGPEPRVDAAPASERKAPRLPPPLPLPLDAFANAVPNVTRKVDHGLAGIAAPGDVRDGVVEPFGPEVVRSVVLDAPVPAEGGEVLPSGSGEKGPPPLPTAPGSPVDILGRVGEVPAPEPSGMATPDLVVNGVEGSTNLKSSPLFEVDLGAHSPSNFYSELGGGDIVDNGGIFVATYRQLEVGSSVELRVLMPGGYEFVASAVVRWARGRVDDESASPGFGAKLTAITTEGRQLVRRFVRNREPLLYDE
jgi:hypothetical protein